MATDLTPSMLIFLWDFGGHTRSLHVYNQHCIPHHMYLLSALHRKLYARDYVHNWKG